MPVLGMLAISGTSWAQSAKIYRVDQAGGTQLLKSSRAIEWSFSQGLCAEVYFQDDLLKDPQNLVLLNDKNAQVSMQKKEIRACLTERSATFSLQNRSKEDDSRGYLIELPFSDPTLVADPDCKRLKLQGSALWKGNVLAVGMKCSEAQSPRRLFVELLATKVNQELISPMKVELMPSVEKEVVFGSQKVKLKWLEAPAKIIPIVVATPAPPLIKKSFETSVLFGPLSEQHRQVYTTGTLYANGTEVLKVSDLQYNLGLHMKWDRPFFWGGRILEGTATLGFLGKLNHIWNVNVIGSGPILKSKIFSIGLGAGNVGMIGSQTYGVINAFGLIGLLRAESLNQFWGASIYLQPLMSKGGLLSATQTTLSVNGGFVMARRKVKVGVDVNSIAIPAKASGDPVDYFYKSYGLHIEYPLGKY